MLGTEMVKEWETKLIRRKYNLPLIIYVTVHKKWKLSLSWCGIKHWITAAHSRNVVI